MENKKKLKVNCAACDIRNLTEEALSQYETVAINAATLITTTAAQALLTRANVRLNCANTITTAEDVRFSTFNGSMVIKPSQAVPAEKTYLVLNGSLEIEAGSETALEGYAGITLNGSVTCPESIAALLGGKIVTNGSLHTYPDGCIRLKKSTELDRFFHLRAKQDALYYAPKRVIALSPDIHFEKLAEKNVRFSTRKLLVSEALAEAAVPLFDESVDISVLPDGCAFINDDAELDEALVKRYGGKLYVAGDLTIGAKAAGLLDQVSFLRVDGDLLVARSLKDRVLGMDVAYGDLYTVGGTVISNWSSHDINAYLLESAEDGLSATDCANISIGADVTPELLREKLVSVINCASVSCASKEQMDVIGLLAHNVASISLSGHGEDEDGDKDKDENVVRINAAFYAF